MTYFNSGDFNWVSKYYDTTARIFFGNSIYQSQVEFLDIIPDGASILIIGGGSGCIIQEIYNQTKNCKIYFCEKSDSFIAMAKQRSHGLNNVIFRNKSFDSNDFENQFDVVIANYYLDLYSKKELKAEIDSISKVLSYNGLLFVSDFRICEKLIKRLWQLPLISIMYLFFRLTAGISNNQLEDVFDKVERNGFREVCFKAYYSNLIVSKVFIRYHQKQVF